jgi:PAS domain-containing protein/anti-sigma regulatory factor (Ser/Thr protein kinase)
LFARYAQFIDECPDAAFLWSSAGGIVHANGAAYAWTSDLVQGAALEAAAVSVAVNRRAEEFTLAETPFLMLPLIDSTDRARYTLGIADHELRDLPILLHTLHENSRHFSEIVHLLTQIVLTARPDGTFDYASRRWHQTIGTPAPETDIAASMRRAAGMHAEMLLHMWARGVREQKPFTFQIPLRTIRGTRWHEFRSTPVGEEKRIRKWIVTIDDIHERMVAQAELAAAHRRFEALSEIGGILLDSSLPIEELVTRALTSARRVFDAIWIASFEIDGRTIAVVEPSDARMFERALDGGREALGATALMLQWNDETPRPVLRMPLQTGAATARGLACIGAPGHVAFDQNDAAFFSEVAGRIGVALANTITYRRESRIASVLQTAMLPVALPRTDGLTFDVAYRPAEIQAQVGGDWYDAFELPDGRVAISIGDVAGHGLDAAVVMGHVRESIRVAAMEGLDAGGVLSEANRAVVNGGYGLVSAFVGYMDPLTLWLEYASAGHLPPLVVDPSGGIRELLQGDVILGATHGAVFKTMSERLSENLALVLYTDGLVEYGRDLEAGESALRGVLSAWAERGFDANANEIAKRALGLAVSTDDIAMLVMRTVPIAHLDVMLPGVVPSAGRARVAIMRALANAPFEDRNADFVLASCEAINNAIEHGTRSAHDRFHVALDWDESGVRAVVHSFGMWREPTNSFERGRGLTLMRALTDHMTVNVGKTGTTVRLYLDAKAAVAASPA